MAEIALVLVGCLVEDDRAFSDLQWLKDAWCNRVRGDNLIACACTARSFTRQVTSRMLMHSTTTGQTSSTGGAAVGKWLT